MKYMITSTSGFTCHRLLFDKPTIVGVPEGVGIIPVIAYENQLTNPNYLFLNSQKDMREKVIEQINKWKI